MGNEKIKKENTPPPPPPPKVRKYGDGGVPDIEKIKKEIKK